jgi:hypothetical protein
VHLSLSQSEKKSTSNDLSPDTTHTNAIKLASENLQHHQREAELPQAGADVGALKGALRGADLDQFLGGQDDALGAVEAQTVAGLGMASLFGPGCEKEDFVGFLGVWVRG